jgi:hypothetical protein
VIEVKNKKEPKTVGIAQTVGFLIVQTTIKIGFKMPVEIHKLKCTMCSKEFELGQEADAVDHETKYCIKNSAIPWNWFRVTKSYQGGYNNRYVQSLDTELSNAVIQYIGEKTSGGENYGFSMSYKKIDKNEAEIKHTIKLPRFYRGGK